MILALLALALAQNPPPPGVIDRHPLPEGADVLRTYEVRDLLPEQVLKPKELRELGYVGEPDTNVEPASRKQRAAAIEFLSDVIANEVQPSAKPDFFRVRITPSGTLVLHATLAQHEWTQTLLDRNRLGGHWIYVQAAWIEGPKGGFEKMGMAAGASATVLALKERERFLALDKDDPRFEVRTAPRMAVSVMALGNLSVTTALAYIKNYRLETVQPGNVQIADPEIAHIDEGVELLARGLVIDKDRVALALEASTTAVKRPISTKKLKLAPDLPTEVTIALPEVERKSVEARCTLAPEGLVAFCVPCAGKEERELLILVSARAASAAELQAPPKDAPSPR